MQNRFFLGLLTVYNPLINEKILKLLEIHLDGKINGIVINFLSRIFFFKFKQRLPSKPTPKTGSAFPNVSVYFIPVVHSMKFRIHMNSQFKIDLIEIKVYL